MSDLYPEWLHQLQASLSRYALPLLFGPPPHPRREPEVSHGTCSVVAFDDKAFLLTAAHVLQPALDAVRAAPTQIIAGPLALDLDRARLSLDKRLDIATVTITADQLRQVEAEGFRAIRPDRWPPPPVEPGDGVVFVGYPRVPWRSSLSWRDWEFRSISMLLVVDTVREEEFICHRDPEFAVQRQATAGEELPPLDTRGTSGAPTFLVRKDPVLVPRLCGIVKQDLPVGENLIVYYAKLGTIDRTGMIGIAKAPSSSEPSAPPGRKSDA